MISVFVKSIHVYPVKSFAGVSRNEALVTQRGFQNDRRWMLVDKEGVFISQRNHPQLCFLKAMVVGPELYISDTRSMEYIAVPLGDMSANPLKEVQVWDDKVSVNTADDHINRWLSKNLGVNCELVFQPDDSPRPVDPKYAPNPMDVSLSDGYPFLLTSQKSLDELNGRLSTKIGMDRFRPNIVIDGTGLEAFLEDSWKKIKIGAVEFQLVKPCARCVVTTVNPTTGEKGKEPLKTLATYRNQDGKVLFGHNMVALGKGMVRVGDKVQIQ